MTFLEAYNSGKVFAKVHETYSLIYYPTCTILEYNDGDCYYILDAVDPTTFDKTHLVIDDPEIEILEDLQPSDANFVWIPGHVGSCTCDFYSVILVSGCKCGGK